jgi:hypothetical protein
MANALTDPPFAANPPVKVNIDAKILGLVIAILAILGAILNLFVGGLFSIFAFAGGFAFVWFLGVLIALIADIVGAIGGFRMYNADRTGKVLVIYGLALGVLGSLVHLIGILIAYSGIYAFGFTPVGDIIGFIFTAIIYFLVYYIVVISRFPGDAPVAPMSSGGYGGTPPPPPPSV